VVLEVCAETAPKGPHPGPTHPRGGGCGPELKKKRCGSENREKEKGKGERNMQKDPVAFLLLLCSFVFFV
jgi:hypothetical protein